MDASEKATRCPACGSGFGPTHYSSGRDVVCKDRWHDAPPTPTLREAEEAFERALDALMPIYKRLTGEPESIMTLPKERVRAAARVWIAAARASALEEAAKVVETGPAHAGQYTSTYHLGLEAELAKKVRALKEPR